MSDLDLTGAWHGHYEQHGSRHGMAMNVVQKGESLVGSMRDDETLWMSHDTLVREGDEKTSHPVDVLTELPAESVIEGEVQGRAVTFVKSYRGTHRFTVWLREHSVSSQVDGHQVQYRGEADVEGRIVRGEWSILGGGGSGAFELRRD